MARPKGQKNKPGHKAGKPRKEFNKQLFESLCKIHCTQNEICDVMEMNTDTLVKNLQEQYSLNFAELKQRFASHGKASLRRIQFRMAETSCAMAIWLGKQYLGQSEKVEVTNNDLVNETLEFAGVPKSAKKVNGRFQRFYG